MKFAIPNGVVVPRTQYLVVDDTHASEVFSSACMQLIQGPLGPPGGAPLAVADDLPVFSDLQIRTAGTTEFCKFWVVGQAPPLVVFSRFIKVTNEMYYHLIRSEDGQEWRLCTQMLVLPADVPESRSDVDAAADALMARMYLFAAQALYNNWF